MDRLSAAASAAVHWTESGTFGHEHGFSALRQQLALYRAFLSRPGSRLRPLAVECGCPECEFDDIGFVRDALRDSRQALPPSARAELGRMLAALDDEFRRRTLPDPDPLPAHWADRSGRPRAWWHRRLRAER
ncbi:MULTISPECIES: hypothetical protein [unclassified Streptomyces]|uniref:hypothetical protein n=1 Tax=unclassified Streptomyces TaxID=2593676 RepID=UPI003645F6F2